MRRQLLLLCSALALSSCAHPLPLPEGQQTADAGFIRFSTPINEKEEVRSESQTLDRERLRHEIFTLDSEIANKQAQITHFQMLGDNLWDNQTNVLKTEMAILRARKAEVEAQLQ